MHQLRPWRTRASWRSARAVAVSVASVFAVLGAAWVLVTDLVLYRSGLDAALVARLETAKGWGFVALATVFLYLVTHRYTAPISRLNSTLRAILDGIADGVLLLGADRAIAYANPAATRMLRTSLAQLTGMGAPEFARRFRVSHTDGRRVRPEQFASQRVFDEGGPLQYPAVLSPPGADPMVISVTAAAVREFADEPPALVVSVFHDLSAHARLERLREQLFAAAAHALKTPVAVIRTNAQVLARRSEPPDARLAHAIDRQCVAIDRLVENLLVLARSSSGTLQLHPQVIAVAPLVERIAREASTGAHRVRAEPRDRARVFADPERLALAVRNAIDEALHASADAAVTVLVCARGNDVAIGVRRPPGLPEPRDTGDRDDDALRLGRTVTATIVDAHGGAVRIEETEDGRTTWIRLPGLEERRDA